MFRAPTSLCQFSAEIGDSRRSLPAHSGRIRAGACSLSLAVRGHGIGAAGGSGALFGAGNLDGRMLRIEEK